MKTEKKSNNICVLGAGLWGTVLANHAARRGPVRLWEFFPELARRLEESRRHPHIPRLELKRSVRVTSRIEEALVGALAVLIVLPSAHVRATAARLRGMRAALPGKARWISASKGIEPGSHWTMSEIVEKELPSLRGRLFALSGPSFAREVSRGVPTQLVLAGPAGPARAELKSLLQGPPLNIEESSDRKGVELGGALKNVFAIGCGVLDGLDAGANTKAAFITRALAEMARVIRAAGGRVETAYGPAGIGDLIATGTSAESRNRALGEKLGRGKALARALREIPTVTEGVESARSAVTLSRSLRLSCPLLVGVWKILHRHARPDILLTAAGFP